MFYRRSAQQRARELGVVGHARNLPDGRVDVLAVGEATAVDSFVAWLWLGSAISRVAAVELTELDAASFQPPADFLTG